MPSTHQLILGSCLDVMATLPDASIDCIVSDLPFATTQNQWDSLIPLDQLWQQWQRICVPGAPIICFGQQPFTTTLAASNLKWLKTALVWVKTSPTGHLNAKKYALKAHEDILVFCSQTPPYYPQMSTGHKPYICKRGKPASSNYGAQTKDTLTVSDGTRYPTTVLHYGKDSTRHHPTQKPVALLEYLIRTYTKPGATILDPTMGSGSTNVAAALTGRNSIGIERDPDYYAIAQHRVNTALATMTQAA